MVEPPQPVIKASDMETSDLVPGATPRFARRDQYGLPLTVSVTSYPPGMGAGEHRHPSRQVFVVSKDEASARSRVSASSPKRGTWLLYRQTHCTVSGVMVTCRCGTWGYLKAPHLDSGLNANDWGTSEVNAMAMRGVPETWYATVAGGGQVAYQAIGDGPIDVLVNRMSNIPIDMMWEEPRVVRFLDRLSSFCRHVWFDPRGTGASDSIAHEEGRMVESFVDDMVAVVDHLGCDRVAILGLSIPVGVLFAAAHPGRTRALVLADASVRYRWAEDYPAGWSDREIDERIEGVRKGGLPGAQTMAPSLSGDVAFHRWFNRAGRLNCTWRRLCGSQVFTMNSPKVMGPPLDGGGATASLWRRAATASASARSAPMGCHRRRSLPVSGST
jgi:pimeloyl-ACP methyl ester carboxylesterase